MSDTCQHRDFEVFTRVNRIEDRGAFVADVHIRCADCRVRFRFEGVAWGLSYKEPMASPGGFELRAPIVPDAHQTSLMAGDDTGWPGPST